MKNIITAFLVTCGLATPAFATDLVNYDSKSYKVTLVEGSISQTVNVSSRGSNYGLCTSGPCTFKLGGSSVTVGKNDRVVIENGALKKK